MFGDICLFFVQIQSIFAQAKIGKIGPFHSLTP